jgi:hypothetical protein
MLLAIANTLAKTGAGLGYRRSVAMNGGVSTTARQPSCQTHISA